MREHYLKIHLLNLYEYARNDDSPRPELNDVKATPEMMIQSIFAKATNKNPTICAKHATETRTLSSRNDE